jgi:hypothetical protein
MVTANLSFLDNEVLLYHSTLQLESVKDVDKALDAELSNLKMAIFAHIYKNRPSEWHEPTPLPNTNLLNDKESYYRPITPDVTT